MIATTSRKQPVWLSQLAASTIAVYGLGPDFRLLPELLPFLLERGLLVLALVYFINLTNFMDGLDLMVVAGSVFPWRCWPVFQRLGWPRLAPATLPLRSQADLPVSPFSTGRKRKSSLAIPAAFRSASWVG